MTRISSLSSRPWSGPDDLRSIQALVSAAWRSPIRPRVPLTVGDLEWWIASGGLDVDWSERIRIWSVGGDPIAWGWVKPPAALDWFVSHELNTNDEVAVRRDILAWHADVARTASWLAAAPEPAERVTMDVWAAEGWPESAIVRDLGWTASDVALTQYLQPLDVELVPPRVPDGYILRSVRVPDDLEARVAVHRAAFAPSKMTVEKYRILVAQDHYAPERDIVLEASDGTFAAFAMCWADPVGSIGEFEPRRDAPRSPAARPRPRDHAPRPARDARRRPPRRDGLLAPIQYRLRGALPIRRLRRGRDSSRLRAGSGPVIARAATTSRGQASLGS